MRMFRRHSSWYTKGFRGSAKLRSRLMRVTTLAELEEILRSADPAEPFAQAYFPVRGWPSRLVPHDTVIDFAAGRYGMYRFDINENNLLVD